jgi:hypothetical protein
METATFSLAPNMFRVRLFHRLLLARSGIVRDVFVMLHSKFGHKQLILPALYTYSFSVPGEKKWRCPQREPE